MPLYGHELSDSIDPFSAGLAWAIKLDKGDFVGREALEEIQGQPPDSASWARRSKGSGSPARARSCSPANARSAR